MPRDVFWHDPDGNVVMQAWVSFVDIDESKLTREELDVHLTWEEVKAFGNAMRGGGPSDSPGKHPAG